MSTFENHCQESIKLSGQPYEKVHLWLDEFQGRQNTRCVIAGLGTMRLALSRQLNYSEKLVGASYQQADLAQALVLFNLLQP